MLQWFSRILRTLFELYCSLLSLLYNSGIHPCSLWFHLFLVVRVDLLALQFVYAYMWFLLVLVYGCLFLLWSLLHLHSLWFLLVFAYQPLLLKWLASFSLPPCFLEPPSMEEFVEEPCFFPSLKEMQFVSIKSNNSCWTSNQTVYQYHFLVSTIF